jgi:hypothetical protein
MMECKPVWTIHLTTGELNLVLKSLEGSGFEPSVRLGKEILKLRHINNEQTVKGIEAQESLVEKKEEPKP